MERRRRFLRRRRGRTRLDIVLCIKQIPSDGFAVLELNHRAKAP